MRYFAKINDNNIVQNISQSEVDMPGWVEYFINSANPKHREAVIGGTYDKENLYFVNPKPYESWTLDENGNWKAPVDKPEGISMWDEDAKVWIDLDSVEILLPEGPDPK